MKKIILDKYMAKKIKRKEAAELLQMHPNAVSRLKKAYLEYGDIALEGRKPGPKGGAPDNKTPEHIEEIVEAIALENPGMGPNPLHDTLADEWNIRLHPVTIWRILKRRKTRYTATYKRWKEFPKLYCMDIPGRQLQLDACFPYGRERRVVAFDAIDDCSRWVFGKVYEGEECDDTAIAFAKELIRRAPFRIESIRIDNGYGKKFVEFCEQQGIQIVRNPPYSPEKNGKIERYHRTFKQNFLYKYCSFTDELDEINYKYFLWLEEYNFKRRHSGFGMNNLTPAQKIVVTFVNLLQNLPLKKVTGTLQQNRI